MRSGGRLTMGDIRHPFVAHTSNLPSGALGLIRELKERQGRQDAYKCQGPCSFLVKNILERIERQVNI